LQKGALVGPYEIVALVGAGGMGKVYRARDERIGRDVAIKVLPPEFATDPERLRRFEQEARAAGALDHPNILSVHDVGSFEGSPYMVTEFLEGETLRDWLHGAGLTVRRAAEVAIQIARGLAAAHEKGIVHRDLKPGNVFVTKDGHVKILDFGIAKLTRPDPRPQATTLTPESSTETGALIGTVGYTSPEQVRGLPIDHRSDIFSFGCVLYEMLSSRSPFLKETPAETMTAILHEDPPALAGTGRQVPPGLCQIVRRCLEKRPQDRFSSAHDLAFALEAAATDTSGGRAIPEVAPRGTPVGILLATAAAGVVVLVALGFWFARKTGSAPLPKFSPRRVAGQLGVVSEPALSPNGAEIAYTASERGTSEIWVVDVRGGKPIRLTETSSVSFGAAWLPDGSAIAFSSSKGAETSIWKVPRFGGTAMLLVPNAQDAAISPGGERIAFARQDKDGYRRIWVAPLGAPEQARRLTTGKVGVWSHRHPAWSPDGRTICFQDKRNLWLVPAAGGSPHPLTVGDATNLNPVWSTDGRHVYFVSFRDGTQSLWRQALSGGDPVRVTHGAGPEKSLSISRDGRRLALTTGLETFSTALVDMQTGAVSTVQGGRTAEFATIAPDRSAIVFESDLAGPSDLWSLPLRGNAPAGDPARLTDHPGTCAVPAFSPDGRWIAYYRVVDGQRDVWVIPANGGAPVNFTGHPAVDIEPAWSPDGRQIAFVSDRGGRDRIWAAPFAEGRRTGESRRITDDEGSASYPSWSPDGQAITYVLQTNTGSEVRLAPADATGPSRSLTAGAQAYMVRWWWAKNLLVVSGYFREVLPSIRLVPPGGEEVVRLALPAPVAPDPEYPMFELSRDGTLLALFQSTRQDEIWVLESEEGAF
jgi:Tol biopolymer transport system component